MIPDLAIIVAAYVIVRLFSLLFGKGEREENAVVKTLAVIAILVTVVCVTDIILKSKEVEKQSKSGATLNP